MHDVLRQRLLRRIETLPEDQVYQVLDYIEFLESKYAPNMPVEASGLQRLAENLEDRLRRKALSPNTLREAFQLIAAADRVLSSVASAGRQIVNELGVLGEGAEGLTSPPAPPSASRPGSLAERRRGGPDRGESSGAEKG